MRKYEKYKPSGVEWIGEVPSHWNYGSLLYNIKHIRTGLNPRDNFKLSNDAPLYYVTIKNFKDGVLYLDENCDKIDVDAWNKIQIRSDLHKGDILFASIAQSGQAYILKEEPKDWNINESVFSIRINDKKFNCDFFYYLITSKSYFDYLHSDATGTTFTSIKQEMLKHSCIIIPPLSEQAAIASYLDAKCSKIDNVIGIQQKRIGLLKELKQSTITKAVTKGLNKNAKMKDSGVEWIGEVPEGWKVMKLKFVAKRNDNSIKIGPFGSALTGKILEDGECKVYGQWNIIGNDFTAGNSFISVETYNELIAYKVVPNDILISMMGTVGKCSIIPQNIQDGIMDSHVVKMRVELTVINPHYFEYVYDKDNCQIVFGQIQKNKKGTIMDGLNSTLIKEFLIPVPPLSEQTEITAYLDKKCSTIDRQISKIERQIELLKEYKQSVITECVTGKRKVC